MRACLTPARTSSQGDQWVPGDSRLHVAGRGSLAPPPPIQECVRIGLESPARSAQASRRGIAVGMLVVSLVCISACLALAWNVARLIVAHEQIEQACQSAALAAAAELHRAPLLSERFDPAANVLSARAVARRYAGEHVVAGEPVAIDTNLDNDPRGDVCIGRVREPLAHGAPLEPVLPGETANAVRVAAGRSVERGNALSLWFGRTLGLLETDVTASARAVLDRRVVGFRPRGATTVPLAPVAVVRSAWEPLHVEGGDRYTLDPHTGEVSLGGDGVAELLWRVPLAGEGAVLAVGETPASDWVLMELTGDDARPEVNERRWRRGLDRDDLARWGGEIVLDPDAAWRLSVSHDFTGDWGQRLASLRGQTRVWPVGWPVEGGAAAMFDVTGWGAGAIVDVTVDPSAERPTLLVIVQPARLSSGAAITRRDATANPYLAKIFLSE